MTEGEPDGNLSILLLTEDFYPKESGGAFIDWNTATHLADVGDRVTVVTPRDERVPSRETVDGVEIRRPFRGTADDTHPNSWRGQLRRILFVVLVAPYLLNLARREEFDLVYSTNHLLHPVAAILSTLFRLPHVSFVGYSPSIQDDVSLTDPLVLLERMNFRLFMGDRVLCQTPSVYEELRRLSDAEVERLDGIVDSDAICEAAESETELDIEFNEPGMQLIYVGRLVSIKNPTKLPRIISELPSNYSLYLIGDGPRRSAVEDAIQETNVEDRVHLIGRLPHKETLQAIHEADLLVLPSKCESYGAVVFEALSLKTPVLATPVSILPFVEHSRLTTADLNDFTREISEQDWISENGIDTETLNRFSVERFTHEVRTHLLKSLERY